MNDGHQECFLGLELEKGYSTSENDLLTEFYEPVLTRAVSYDRAVGYFSSSLIALAPLAYRRLVMRQGAVRIVCSPHISPQDASRLGLGSDDPHITREEVALRLKALADADDLADALTGAMSSLLSAGILKLKFAEGPGGNLFHDKIGVLKDPCGHTLSFVGSANETAAAWSGLGNHEQIEAFYAWESGEQEDRVRRHRRQFEEIWHDLARGLSVRSANESMAIVYDVREPSSPEVALARVREAIEGRRGRRNSATLGNDRPLRKHQEAVLESWKEHANRGLVAFATGGGKTLVGINAVRAWIDEGRPALILVPSTLLHRQWVTEMTQEIPNLAILRAGAGHPRHDWVRNLRAATDPDPSYGPRIILSTYQTATTGDFLSRVRGGEHLLVVADEVHRMGAPDTRRLFDVDAGGRLGLSATPDRYGDEVGTSEIHSYFGDILEPPFGITEAIQTGQLVPYDYYLETVTLLPDEMDRWDELSRSLAQEIARNDGKMTDRAVRIARDRAKVLKSAAGKASLAERVLRERFQSGDRWLVYCDDLRHLRSVREIIEPLGLPTYEYHSRNSYLGPEIFEHFARGGVLLAVKCLDEGVDLPFINKALILASTSNPREYIQRRGRVLRRAEGKHYATVVDAAVIDHEGLLLSLTEAVRASEFAGEAQNRAGKFALDALTRRSRGNDRWRRDETALEEEEGVDD